MQASHTRLVNNVDNIAGILKTKRDQTELAFQYDMSGFSDANREKTNLNIHTLLPDSLELTYRDNRETTLNGDIVIHHSSLEGSELPDTNETNWTMALNWTWPIGATTLGYSHTFYDSRQIGRETADRKNWVWNASQSLFGDVWQIEGHATLSKDDNLDVSSKSQQDQLDWGGRLDLHFPDLPTLLINYDQGRTKSQDFVFLENSQNRTKRLDVSLDLSPWLEAKWHGNYPPRITLNYQLSDGLFQSNFFKDKTRQSSVTVNLSKQF